MFMGTTKSRTNGLMHVATKGNASNRQRRKSEAEWIVWHFTYSLLCFKNKSPTHSPTLFRGSKRERDSMTILLPSPDMDRQPGNYI